MINKIYKFMQKYRMLESISGKKCECLIIGVSGGADSVCLLLVLKQIVDRYYPGTKLVAVHVNHGIRGEEAMRDQTFVQELCRGIGVECIVRTICVPQLAKEHAMTEEEAGRIARYKIFRELAGIYSHASIAVAHHKNDQAETVLMNLYRGSAVRGLCGMQPVRSERSERLIRPLLCVTRQEIEHFLYAQNQTYLTDSTNLDNLYTRNKIRNVLIPYLQENINPNVTDAVCEMADALTQAEDYIDRQADALYRACVRRTDGQPGREEQPDRTGQARLSIMLDTYAPADPVLKGYVIRKAVQELTGALKDIYRVHIQSIAALEEQQVGKKVSLPYGIEAVRGYSEILIGPVMSKSDKMSKEHQDYFSLNLSESISEAINNSPDHTERIIIPDRIWLPQKESYSYVTIVVEMLENVSKPLEISDNNIYTKYFDYDKIKGNIEVRFRRDGDRIVISQDGILKKFKKELIDRKIPKEKRDSVLLLTVDQEETGGSGNEILWAVGIRRSEAYLIDSRSVRILKISIELQEEEKNETR